ncbi:MAG: hypothetical protein HY327_10560 [Chloroflexi bacterium]|nr:hypothetical protein [Chloroflexota bacterium]
MEAKQKSAVERAIEFGVDITLLQQNLNRTPTERLEQFQRWFEFNKGIPEKDRRPIFDAKGFVIFFHPADDETVIIELEALLELKKQAKTKIRNPQSAIRNRK